MKTSDIETLAEKQLVYQIKKMEIKELERHAHKMLNKLGCDDATRFIAKIIREIPHLNSEQGEAYEEMKLKIAQAVAEPQRAAFQASDLPDRLGVLLIRLIQKKFEKIHNAR